LVVAEIVLSAIDARILLNRPRTIGLRHYDDYEMAFTELADAEDAQVELQQLLLEYELRVNPTKTFVREIPIQFEPAWLYEIRELKFRPKPRGQATDLIRFFDKISEIVLSHRNEHVVRYALSRLSSFVPHQNNWRLYQALLSEALLVEPGAVFEYLQNLILCTNFENAVERGLLEPALNLIVEKLTPLGYHYEVAWALWAIIAFRFNVEAPAARSIERTENSILALLALDAESQGLIPTGLSKASWGTRMETRELWEEEWLLAYEANVHGWLPSVGAGDHVAADPCFSFLKNLNVAFYSSVQGPIILGRWATALAAAYP